MAKVYEASQWNLFTSLLMAFYLAKRFADQLS